MVAVPQYKGSTLKFIQLSRVNERQLIAVVVCEGNVIRNQIINIDEEMDDQTILKLNLLLNTNLNGVDVYKRQIKYNQKCMWSRIYNGSAPILFIAERK